MIKLPSFLVRSGFIAALLLTVGACQSTIPYGQQINPVHQYSDIPQELLEQRQFVVYDPAEGVNKHVYKFNAKLDQYVLLPIVNGYKTVTPEAVRKSVSNFLQNIGEFTNFTNAALQASPKKAGVTLGRFAVNTTVGVLGLFDVATKWGLERQPEDFGQTLGRWGVGPGAYVVLPVLGPSNVRDAGGTIFDIVAFMLVVPNNVEGETAYEVTAYGVVPVDARYRNDFRYFRSGTPFKYELVRYINTQARKLQIAK